MKLSVITINLNNGLGLARTIQSVRQQTFKDFEHIVIDGSSTDGSLDVINKHSGHLAKWVSEPDNGIYNAMNKGIALATGEYLQFLNSGDCLASSDVLEKVFLENEDDGVEMIYGHTWHKGYLQKSRLRRAPPRMTFYDYFNFAICHQSIFYKREMFKKYGNYDESFQLAGDYEYTLRCLHVGAKGRLVDVVVAIYEGGGISTVNKSLAAIENERIWEKFMSLGRAADYDYLNRLKEECSRLRRAENWIEDAKRKPLWYNLAIVLKWRWDKFIHLRQHGANENVPLRDISIEPKENRYSYSTVRKLKPSCSRHPIVHLYAVCLNEALLIPYFLAHYGVFVDRITIFDNGSTDNSIELLSSHPKVQIVPFDTGGKMDDSRIHKTLDKAWKASRGLADFVIVCDIDEFLYHPDISGLLCEMREQDYTVLHPHGYQMSSERLPEFCGDAITKIVNTGSPNAKHYSKMLLFNPNRIKEINYTIGRHHARPTGRIKIYRTASAKLLHYKYVDRDSVLRKHHAYRNNMSIENVKKGFSSHYCVSDEEAMQVFDRLMARAEEII